MSEPVEPKAEIDSIGRAMSTSDNPRASRQALDGVDLEYDIYGDLRSSANANTQVPSTVIPCSFIILNDWIASKAEVT